MKEGDEAARSAAEGEAEGEAEGGAEGGAAKTAAQTEANEDMAAPRDRSSSCGSSALAPALHIPGAEAQTNASLQQSLALALATEAVDVLHDAAAADAHRFNQRSALLAGLLRELRATCELTHEPYHRTLSAFFASGSHADELSNRAFRSAAQLSSAEALAPVFALLFCYRVLGVLPSLAFHHGHAPMLTLDSAVTPSALSPTPTADAVPVSSADASGAAERARAVQATVQLALQEYNRYLLVIAGAKALFAEDAERNTVEFASVFDCLYRAATRPPEHSNDAASAAASADAQATNSSSSSIAALPQSLMLELQRCVCTYFLQYREPAKLRRCLVKLQRHLAVNANSDAARPDLDSGSGDGTGPAYRYSIALSLFVDQFTRNLKLLHNAHTVQQRIESVAAALTAQGLGQGQGQRPDTSSGAATGASSGSSVRLRLDPHSAARLYISLHSFSTPGGPLYPPRPVRHAALSALDSIYCQGRVSRRLVFVLCRALHPSRWPSSVLHLVIRLFKSLVAHKQAARVFVPLLETAAATSNASGISGIGISADAGVAAAAAAAAGTDRGNTIGTAIASEAAVVAAEAAAAAAAAVSACEDVASTAQMDGSEDEFSGSERASEPSPSPSRSRAGASADNNRPKERFEKSIGRRAGIGLWHQFESAVQQLVGMLINVCIWWLA